MTNEVRDVLTKRDAMRSFGSVVIAEVGILESKLSAFDGEK